MTRLAFFASILCLGFQGVAQTPAYRNPDLPIEQRVNDLLARMTPEEKFWQCFMIPGNLDQVKPGQYHHGIFGLQLNAVSAQQGAAQQMLQYGSNTDARAFAEKANAVQRYFVEESRLGIPVIFFEEALHGLIAKGATAFPQAIGLAASFDTSLTREVATAIATETRSRGIRQVLSPVVNIASDVRWGRTEETYGEDPYLSSLMGLAYVGTLERAGVICTPKHFVANTGDGGRDSYPIEWNERFLREVHLPPFQTCVQVGGARSIMTSYNSLNGSPTSANTWLLDTLLKQEYGFDGFVISDAGAVGGANVLHFTASDYTDATRQAMRQGLDVIFQTEYEHFKLFMPPFLDGSIPHSRIDDAVRRVLRAKFQLGLFENPYVQIVPDTTSGQHGALAQKAAERSIVLLQNPKKTLPLQRNQCKKIAVLGPDAAQVRLGGYSGKGNQPISILEGMVECAGAGVEVKFAEGATRNVATTEPIPATALYQNRDLSRAGLLARYYRTVNFTGEAVQQTDERLAHQWTLFGPACLQTNQFYSVEWSGFVRAPRSGALAIGLSGNDGYRLWLNGKLVVDRLSKQSFHTDLHTLHCTEGEAVEVRVQFYEPVGGGRIQLIWDANAPRNTDTRLAEAVALARTSDVAVVVVGIEEGEFQDRALLGLPGNQEALIQAVAATGVPLVVVLVGGSAVTMQGWQEKADAIMQVWYPGQAGGRAVARTLFGDVNPAGRLPITWPIHEGQLPLVYHHKPTGRCDDYLNLSGQPLFPFGFGLSYTEFAYTDLRLAQQRITKSDTLRFSCKVTNTGTITGDEVVQVYLRDEVASVARPVQELKAFQRITLAPGQSKEVQFDLTPAAFTLLDASLHRLIESGSFRLMVGASARDIRLVGEVVVE